MSEMLRKRAREPEALLEFIDAGEPKRFQREETDLFLALMQLDRMLSVDDDEEDYAVSEELVNAVMKSLEEEIAVTCSISYSTSNSRDNSTADDISSRHQGQTLNSDSRDDFCCLHEASEDELGITPSHDLDLKDKVCQSLKGTSDDMSESTEL